MLLVIDAGNTNAVFAVYREDELISSWRIKTDSGRTRDQYASWLLPLFSQAGLQFGEIRDVVISSVVPDANHHLRGFCRQYMEVEPRFVLYDIPDTGVEIRIETPAAVGADRIVNAVAVGAYYTCPAVVVDFGTSTNFDVIDADGAFAGGALAPGVNLSVSALHQAAAMLPKVSVRPPPAAIGKDTVAAMQSGVYWGYVGLIEGILARITAEIGEKPLVIATGGLAPVFAENVPMIDIVDRDLTLKGLLRIYQQEQTKKHQSPG